MTNCALDNLPPSNNFACAKLARSRTPAIDPYRKLWRNLDARSFDQTRNPIRGPFANRVGIGRFGSTEQLLRKFLVLFEVRMLWKGERVLRVGKHTNLLSFLPGIRTDQAERRFVPSVELRGWARPFPRTGCAPCAPHSLSAVVSRGQWSLDMESKLVRSVLFGAVIDQ